MYNVIRLYHAIVQVCRWKYQWHIHRTAQRKAWHENIRNIDELLLMSRNKRFQFAELGMTTAVNKLHEFELRMLFAKEICLGMVNR